MDENLKHEMVLSHINKLGTIDCTVGTLQNIAASYDMTWTKRGYHSPQVSEKMLCVDVVHLMFIMHRD